MGKDIGKSVEVHSVLTVVSATPVEQGKTCRLGPVDYAMGRHGLHVIFYYRSGLKFDRIRPALNETLSHYPNVTGRLAKDGDGNWVIKCTDAGVRVFLAKANHISVDEWLRLANVDDEKYLMAVDDLPDDPDYWSPFRLQVTEFEGGGTAIALSCLHMLGDPTFVTVLIKSWTEVYQDKEITHLPFINPLVLHTSSPTKSPPFYATKSIESTTQQPSVKMASTTFSFSDSMIKQSLSKINFIIPDASPFYLLTALFWMRITRLKTPANNQTISICSDIRKRLYAPLPYGYSGNALHFSQLTVDTNDLDSWDLHDVVNLVHDHLSRFKEEEFWSAVAWLQARKGDQGRFSSPFTMYGPELTCVNMEHLIAPVGVHTEECQPLMYTAKFEKDQKPIHVSYHIENVEAEGLILVMPSPEEGFARRVAVTLPEEQMEKLLQDEIILSLEPTLILNGTR